MATSFHTLMTSGRVDRMAVTLSGLCAAHCVTSAVLLAFLASAGGFLDNPLIHEVGLVLAILMGALALGFGAVRHGFMLPAAIGALGLGVMAGAMTMDHGLQEGLYTMLGVAIVALGHDLNHRASR